jgi:hypothetical protein
VSSTWIAFIQSHHQTQYIGIVDLHRNFTNFFSIPLLISPYIKKNKKKNFFLVILKSYLKFYFIKQIINTINISILKKVLPVFK